MKKQNILWIFPVITIFALTVLTCCEKEDPVEVPTITTLSVTEITSNSAKSGGNITDDGGGKITARGVVWCTNVNPSLEDHIGMIQDGIGSGEFHSEMTDLFPSTVYYVRAYATNSKGTSYGNEVMFETVPDEDDYDIFYGDGVTDIDGNEYITVIIGDQEWIAENLRVTSYNNGDAIPTGLNNTEWSNTTDGAYAIFDHNHWAADGINSPEEMVAAYGKLYNWFAVTDPRGLCPEGWSVPSHDDWTQLEQYICNALGNSNCETKFPYDNTSKGWRGTTESNALKSCRQINSPAGGDCDTSEHPRWIEDNYSGLNNYGFDGFGFSALPGGYRWSSGIFFNVGGNGTWWSSTKHSEAHAWYRTILSYYESVGRDYYFKSIGRNVRCFREVDN